MDKKYIEQVLGKENIDNMNKYYNSPEYLERNRKFWYANNPVDKSKLRDFIKDFELTPKKGTDFQPREKGKE